MSYFISPTTGLSLSRVRSSLRSSLLLTSGRPPSAAPLPRQLETTSSSGRPPSGAPLGRSSSGNQGLDARGASGGGAAAAGSTLRDRSPSALTLPPPSPGSSRPSSGATPLQRQASGGGGGGGLLPLGSGRSPLPAVAAGTARGPSDAMLRMEAMIEEDLGMLQGKLDRLLRAMGPEQR